MFSCIILLLLSISVLVDAHMLLDFAILDVEIPKTYYHFYYSDFEHAVISKDANRISKR